MIKSKFHWGNFVWGYIHTISLPEKKKISIYQFNKIKKMLKNVKDIIPCNECKTEYIRHLKILKEVMYTDFIENPLILFEWSYELHNFVNKKLKKPFFSFEKALEKWTV